MVKKIILKCCLCILLLNISYGLSFSQDKKIIRVAIIQDTPSIKLRINSPFEIFTLQTKQSLYKAKKLKTTEVIPTNEGIKLGKKDFMVYAIRIVPQKDATIYVNNRPFRGEITIIRKENLRLLVVNNLDIEDYVRGVLYHEVSHRWPMEALKAQAVIVRSFALHQANINKQKDFDLTSDIYSQVYGGRTSEKSRTNLAVNKTKKEILALKKEIFPTFYHATCGGRTEDANNLWNIDLVPLRGVACNFCKYSPHYFWKKNLRLKDIETKLKDNGYKVEDIINITVLKRNVSGRIETLTINGRTGSNILISGKDFRQIIGPNIIKSNNYDVIMKGYYVDFFGRGWGHGVGLCQWGAKEMAAKGYKYDSILKYYYPGAEIVKR